MEFIEIFLLLYTALMLVTTTRWINQVKKGVISVFNQNLVLLLFSTMVLLLEILRPDPSIIGQIGFVTLPFLVIIYVLNRITVGSEQTQEEARIWLGWAAFWLGVTGLVALMIDRLTTKRESETLLIGVAVAVFTPVYSWVTTINTITKRKSR